MKGKPKYTYGDSVCFKVGDYELEGKVEVIDVNGTYFDPSDVSYDIMVEHSPHYNGEPCLYKHIREDFVHDPLWGSSEQV